MNIRVIMKMEI